MFNVISGCKNGLYKLTSAVADSGYKLSIPGQILLRPGNELEEGRGYCR